MLSLHSSTSKQANATTCYTIVNTFTDMGPYLGYLRPHRLSHSCLRPVLRLETPGTIQ